MCPKFSTGNYSKAGKKRPLACFLKISRYLTLPYLDTNANSKLSDIHIISGSEPLASFAEQNQLVNSNLCHTVTYLDISINLSKQTVQYANQQSYGPRYMYGFDPRPTLSQFFNV